MQCAVQQVLVDPCPITLPMMGRVNGIHSRLFWEAECAALDETGLVGMQHLSQAVHIRERKSKT